MGDKSETRYGQNNTLCAVILTALPIEYNAVRASLTDLSEETHPLGSVYERGQFLSGDSSWEVGIVEIGAGNIRAALETQSAIEYFDPDVMLFVGVAGGIKDVRLGDVVAATKVYAYEAGKAKKKFEPRPSMGISHFRMVHRARAEARKDDWLRRLPTPLVTPVPQAFVGPIAAGEKVVADTRSSVYTFLRSNYGDALAVEMEGYGFLEASYTNPQINAMVICGISDLINRKHETDAEGFQEVAARHASAFAYEILAKIYPVN